MPIVGFIVTAVVGYFLGSIPTGFLLASARGLDIRRVGSGNIGATNVFRSLGVPAGVFVLLMDALKGWLAVMLAAKVFANVFQVHDTLARDWLAITGGFTAILGHNFTCWLQFKGGKGIATSAGVLVALVPLALMIILGIWIIVFAISRYVSLASICAAAALPFAAWLTKQSPTIIFVTGLMGGLAIYKHKGNIRRLLDGTENRIGARSGPTDAKADSAGPEDRG